MNDENKPSTTHTPISSLGEFGLIEHLTKHARHRHPETITGIGDDGAVIKNDEELTVLSTDLLVEGIHFDLMYTPLKHLGYKSVIVNLSDIFAMNATPKQVMVSIALSNRFSVEALTELYEGIHQACINYNVDLIGGDTSSSKSGLVISVTAIGTAAPEQVVYRNKAQEGDHIFVTGDLGAAYLGLQILEREKRIFLENPNIQPELAQHQYLVGRQLRPEARQDIISLFQQQNIVPNAMIDISDGLSSDILHICKQSNVGCSIFEENVPIHPESYHMALEFKLNPITCALSGGEDYELLFTLPSEEAKKVQDTAGFFDIGKITSIDKGTILYGKNGRADQLIAQGWKHL